MNSTQAYFWPPEMAKKLEWLQNWNGALTPALITKYAIAAGDVTYLTQAELVLDYLIELGEVADNWRQAVTERKEAFFSGPATVLVEMPVGPSVPALPAEGASTISEIAGGLDEQVARIVGEIKGKANYDVADGELLGMEGAIIPPPDPATTKPSLKVKLVTGGCPELGVKLSPFKAWELWADYGTGTFVLEQVAMHSKVLCSHALPASGTSEVWRFKAIYRDGEAQYGQFSDVLVVSVAGPTS